MADIRYLHLGCGNTILPSPFENLDIRELPGVDHLGDVYPLTFDDETFDLVYCSHVLEHFYRSETQNIISEWVRVLKPGGTLRLSVPSLEALFEIYQNSKKMSNVIGPLMGGQTYDQNFHYMSFDKATLTELMKNAGLVAIHPWDYRRTEHSDYWDFSQAVTDGIPISLNLEGRKKINHSYKDRINLDIKNNIKMLIDSNDNDYSKTYSELLLIYHSIINEEENE